MTDAEDDVDFGSVVPTPPLSPSLHPDALDADSGPDVDDPLPPLGI